MRAVSYTHLDVYKRQVNDYLKMTVMGDTLKILLDYPLDKLLQELKAVSYTHLPCDSVDNQFKSWVRNARTANADLRLSLIHI